MPNAARRGALVSRRVRRVNSSGIATPSAKGIIGRSTRKYAKMCCRATCEALFKEPPAKEECPICFLPMPIKIINCISLPPATIASVPVHDYAIANEQLAEMDTKEYYECCGKSICRGCIHSFGMSGNVGKCPFCKANKVDKTDEKRIAEMMKRVEAQDVGAMCHLAQNYYYGGAGLLQDVKKAME